MSERWSRHSIRLEKHRMPEVTIRDRIELERKALKVASLYMSMLYGLSSGKKAFFVEKVREKLRELMGEKQGAGSSGNSGTGE